MAKLPRRYSFTAVAVILLGLSCSYKRLPTPTISGPDTAWTNAPVLFDSRMPDGTSANEIAYWDWNDGGYPRPGVTHIYRLPGTYFVTCVLVTPGIIERLEPPGRSSPSKPCTLRVLADTLVLPDTIVDTIPLGPGTHGGLCVLPSGTWLYVTTADSGTVSVIDTRDNTVATVVPLPGRPGCCIANAAGDRVYVSCPGSRSVAVIRTSDNTVAATIQLPGEPGPLALLPGDSLLYVGDSTGVAVSVLRVADDACIARVALRAAPLGLAVKPGGEYVYAACGAAGLSVIRTLDHTRSSKLPFPGSPADIVFSPTGETAYVAGLVADSVILLRTADDRRVGAAGCHEIQHRSTPYPRHLALHPGGDGLYAVSRNGNKLAAWRRSDNYLLRLVGLGSISRPAGAGLFAFAPDGSRAYIAAAHGVLVIASPKVPGSTSAPGAEVTISRGPDSPAPARIIVQR